MAKNQFNSVHHYQQYSQIELQSHHSDIPSGSDFTCTPQSVYLQDTTIVAKNKVIDKTKSPLWVVCILISECTAVLKDSLRHITASYLIFNIQFQVCTPEGPGLDSFHWKRLGRLAYSYKGVLNGPQNSTTQMHFSLKKPQNLKNRIIFSR